LYLHRKPLTRPWSTVFALAGAEFCRYNSCNSKNDSLKIRPDCEMKKPPNTVLMTRKLFLQHRQGRTFADVLNDPEQPFDEVLAFFNDEPRQRRMEESELHHDRPPLAGVVRELEAQPAVDQFLSTIHAQRSKRLRQAIGVLVRIIMEGRGWRKTGRKGSLGVRAATAAHQPNHNTGGLAFWFIRAERYELPQGMPFESVKVRRRQFGTNGPVQSRTKSRRSSR
jgi:hypothetical protein